MAKDSAGSEMSPKDLQELLAKPADHPEQASTGLQQHEQYGSLNFFQKHFLCFKKNPTKLLKSGEQPSHIWGVPLRQSITYANVAISLQDAEGKSYIYGYVPIVVAKCGVYLKEHGGSLNSRVIGRSLD